MLGIKIEVFPSHFNKERIILSKLLKKKVLQKTKKPQIFDSTRNKLPIT